MAEKVLFEVRLDVREAQKRAAELTTAISRMTQERKVLNKELRDLQKEERDLVKAREAAENTLKSLIDTQGAGSQAAIQAQKDAAELAARQTALAETIRDTAGQLNIVQGSLSKARSEQRRLIKEIDAAPNSLDEQRAALSRLKAEYSSFSVGIDGTEKDLEELKKNINSLTDEINEQEQSIQVFGRNVGNYAGGILKAFDNVGGPLGNVTKGLGALKAIPGPVALISSIGVAGKKLIDFQQQLEATRKKISQLTGTTGDELNQVTAISQATAETFNVQVDDVAKASNAVAKQFGDNISFVGNEIQKVFAVGGNVTGRALDNIEEYSVGFSEAGVSASEFLAIVAQEPQTGIVSGKGLDTVKEAAIRLRELTPATASALDGIGLASEEIEESLRNGSSSIFEVIQTVSSRLDELPPQSKEVGTAIADIFGGPGEDAGLQYIKTLKDVQTNLDTVISESGEYTAAQQRLADANERINLSLNRIFQSADGVFDGVIATGKEFIATVLEGIVNGGVGVINFFRSAYNESIVFRGGLQAIGATISSVGDVFGAVFDGIKTALAGTGQLFKAIFTGDFAAIPGIIKNTFSDAVNIGNEAGKSIAQNYIDGFQEALTPERKLEMVSLSDPNAAESSYSEAGGKAAKAFNRTFNKEALEEESKLLQAKLLAAEQGTKEEFELRRELARNARDQIFADEEATRADRLLAEAQFQEELRTLQEEETEANEEKETEIDTSAIEARRAQIEAELIAVEEGSKRELELRRELATQLRDLALADAELTKEGRLLIQAEYLAEISALNQEALDRELDIYRESLEAQILELKIKREQDLLTDEEYFAQLNELKAEQIQIELEQFEEGSIQRLELELELAEVQADSVEKTEERKRKAREDSITQEERYKKATEKVSGALIDSANAVLDVIISNTEEESKTRKTAVALKKTLAIAEVTIESGKQVANAITTGSNIAKDLPAPAGPILGAAYTALQIIFVAANLAANIATISGAQYKTGGLTGKDGEPLLIQEGAIGPDGRPKPGARASYEGRPVQMKQSFAEGGSVPGPTLGLIGERGAEYVVPNKVLQTKEGAEMVSHLERIRVSAYESGGFTSEREFEQSRENVIVCLGWEVNNTIKAFERGGYTEKTFSSFQSDRFETYKPGEDFLPFVDGGFTARSASEPIQQTLGQGNAFAEVVEELPPPVVLVEDIRSEVGNQVEVEEEARIG